MQKVFKDILSLVLIVKNGAEYIKEWVEFHRIVGVDHFYIYDNESSDDLKKELGEYIQKGIVTYTYWPGNVIQLSAYNDAIKKYKYTTKYLGFIDADEYIVPVECDNIVTIIEDIFNKYKYCGGVGINWRMYGSSFHEKKVKGLVLENYKYRAEDNYVENRHIKTVCNPRVVKGFFVQSHSLTYIEPYHCVSEYGNIIEGPFFDLESCNRIRINHYHLKSKEDYYEKRRRGWPSRVTECPSDEIIEKAFIQKDESYNKIYDDILDKYIDELRKRCGIV